MLRRGPTPAPTPLLPREVAPAPPAVEEAGALLEVEKLLMVRKQAPPNMCMFCAIGERQFLMVRKLVLSVKPWRALLS